jgi:oligopeptide/dipeptide ABC transporter ATP-binding protein
MILQDPLTSLDPLFKSGDQIAEALPKKGRSAKQKVRELLKAVRISDPDRRMSAFPHQLSGGMRQRIVAAIGLASEPTILLADEPTTALDSTIQVQFLSMLKDVQRENGLAMILVTHDLGVVRRACEQVAVMYAGRIIERGPTEAIFRSPHHPYTGGLIHSIPDVSDLSERLPTIEGQPPDPAALPTGCPFRTRCDFAMEVCAEEYPPIRSAAAGHSYACWLEPDAAAEKLAARRATTRARPNASAPVAQL